MKSKRIKRLALFALGFGVVLVVLIFVVRAMLPGIAEKYDITYSELEFDFPSTLSVSDLKYDQELVSVVADSIHVEWRWQALVKGELSGQLVYAQNFLVDLKDVPPDPNDTSEFDISDLMTIQFDKIQIDGGVYQSFTGLDTMAFGFGRLHAAQFKIDDGIFADTLIGFSGNTRLAFLDTTSMTDETYAGADAELADMFPIDVGYLRIDEHVVTLHNPEQMHRVSDLGITMHGISTENPIDTRVDRIHFTYQDTLEFSTSGDEYFMERSGGMAMKNFELLLPGVEINIASAEVPSESDSVYAVEFGRSSISSNWIHFFVDSLPLPRDESIFFDGVVEYKAESIRLKNFKLNAGLRTKILLSADLSFESDSYPFHIFDCSITTSSADINHLLDTELTGLKEGIGMSADISARGDSSNIEFGSHLIFGNTLADASGLYVIGDDSSTVVNVSVSVPKFDPRTFIADFKEELVGNNLIVQSEILLSKDYELSELLVDLSLDELAYNSFDFSELMLETSFGESGTEISFREANQIENILLKSPSNLLTEESFDLEGEISGLVPNLMDYKENTGSVDLNFKGQFSLSDTSTSFGLESDSLQYMVLSDSSKYSIPFELAFEQSDISGYDLKLFSDSTSILAFEADTSVVSWVSAGLPIDTGFPRIDGYLSLSLDSVLVQSLVGVNGEIALERLLVNSTVDAIDIEVTSSHLRYEDYETINLQIDEVIGDNQLTGQVLVDRIISDYVSVETVSLHNDTDQDGTINTKLDFLVSSTQKEVKIGFDFQEKDGVKKIVLDEDVPLVFGDDLWRIEDNTGLIINPKNSIEASAVAIQKEKERISFDYDRELVSVDIENLKLTRFASFFLTDTTWHATANLHANYHADDKETKWDGVVEDIRLDTVEIGSLKLDGLYLQENLDAHAAIENEKGSLDAHVDGVLEDLDYKVVLNHFDLQSLNPILEVLDFPVSITGNSSGQVVGKVNEFELSEGSIAFENTRIISPDFGLDVLLQNETVGIENDRLNFSQFTLRDKRSNQLVLGGEVGLNDQGKISLTANTDNFVIENADKRSDLFWGECAFSTDLELKGDFDSMLLSGRIKLLENSDLNFKYESSLQENELENEIIFRKKNSKPDNNKKVERKNREKGILTYDVDFDIGKSTAYVLISEASNDFVRLTFSGQIEMKSGVGNMPFLYGKVESHDGSIFYDAPMVSDLKLKIIEASATFNGLAENTKFSFKGRETFRVNLSEIGQSQRSGKVPVDVVAQLNNSTASNLDMTFDLESENGQAQSFIESLPMETSNQYAMNLLVFGSLEGTGGSGSVMSVMFAKLNEISRRNLKNADLNFYVDSQVGDETTGSSENVNEIGYNFETGMYNDKIRLKVGGEYLSGNTTIGRKDFNPLADVELDYVLKRDPDFYLTLRKQDSYRGVIDGQVDEYSVGFTYSIQFKNLFSPPKDTLK